MSTSQGESARRTRRTITPVVAIVASILCISSNARSQTPSCPDDPTDYDGVLEGPVTGPNEKGLNGAVTITSEGVAGLALVSNSEPLALGTNIKVIWNGKTVFTGTFEGVFSTKPLDAKAHAPN